MGAGARRTAQAQREARVLAAAHDLFSAKGYEATSMRQIAERAGVSVGTVANTGDKASLLSQMFSDNQTMALLGRLAVLGSSDPTTSLADEVASVFDDWFTHLEHEPELVRSYFVGLCCEAEAGRADQDFSVIQAIATRLVAHHPHVPQQRASDIAFAIYSCYAVMMVAVIIGSLDHAQARAQVHQVVESLTAGL